MWVHMLKKEVEKVLTLLDLDRSTEAEQLRGRLQRYLDEELDPLHTRYRELASQLNGKDGELEFDSDAVVSLSDEGAYVMGWSWVYSDAAFLE